MLNGMRGAEVYKPNLMSVKTVNPDFVDYITDIDDALASKASLETHLPSRSLWQSEWHNLHS